MALQNIDRLSLDIQAVLPDDGDDGKAIQKEHSQSWKPETLIPKSYESPSKLNRDKTACKRSFSDSALDPTGPAFHFRKWAENILGAASDEIGSADGS
jgi:hypothetical protein